ncbi:unnamed protein product [marine sediment metagenome]|uniref:Uncharacterized protein n=1 Tax=marine sediment metagenome TaxID=412755 RepID=X0VZ03_9ZZZZ
MNSTDEFIAILAELWGDLERDTQIDIYTKLVIRPDMDRVSLRILECAINPEQDKL